MNGIFRTASIPWSGSSRHGVLRDGQHDDRDVRRRRPEWPLATFGRSCGPGGGRRRSRGRAASRPRPRPRLSPLVDDVEHLDLRLGVEQRAHVRRHLGNVFDYQQSDLLAGQFPKPLPTLVASPDIAPPCPLVRLLDARSRCGARSPDPTVPDRVTRRSSRSRIDLRRGVAQARPVRDTRAGSWPEVALSYHRVVPYP